MIGINIGMAIGPAIGPAIGINADAPSSGSGIPGVTRDAASGWYCPANATEWTALMAAAGLATGIPSDAWLCREASGNLADSIGSVPLTQTGAGHLYQQAVAGWSRKAVMTVDGTAGQKWINTTVAPDPAAVSTIWGAYISMPGVAPAANRDLIANSATLDFRLNATGKLSIINGGTTNGTANPLGGTRIALIQHDITNSAFIGFTDQEKIVGTFAANTTNPSFMVGGQTAAAAAVGYLYMFELSGAAAQLTSAQAKTLITTLTGIVPPWS